MGPPHSTSIAERLLGKAEMKLSAARELYDKGFFEDSASRSHYAMFHAARAALTKAGVTTRTHEGTVSEFGRRLVLKGVCPRDLGRALAEARLRGRRTSTRPPSKSKQKMQMLLSDTLT